MGHHLDNLKKRLETDQTAAPVTGQPPLKLRRVNNFKVSREELLDVCDSNPDHPASIAYRRACQQCAPNAQLAVDRVDLEAILTDMQVVVVTDREQQDIEGLTVDADVTTKKLVKWEGDAKERAVRSMSPARTAIGPPKEVPLHQPTDSVNPQSRSVQTSSAKPPPTPPKPENPRGVA
jgi:hypothetical protein